MAESLPNVRQTIDVSRNEVTRFYIYDQGRTYRIDDPVTVYILTNGSHRVVDKDGATHRPSEGFLGIKWVPKPGQPAFVA